MIGRFVAQPLPYIRPGASTVSEKNVSGEAPENGRRQNDKGGIPCFSLFHPKRSGSCMNT